MAFSNGAIFRVTDTLCGGVVGSWRAILLGRNNSETIHGVIPNKERLVLSTALGLTDKILSLS